MSHHGGGEAARNKARNRYKQLFATLDKNVSAAGRLGVRKDSTKTKPTAKSAAGPLGSGKPNGRDSGKSTQGLSTLGEEGGAAPHFAGEGTDPPGPNDPPGTGVSADDL